MKRNNRSARALNNCYEKLEPRQMLASVTFIDGALKIFGTPGNDSVRVVERAGVDEIELGGDISGVYAKSEVKSIQFWGLGGEDTMNFTGPQSGSSMTGLELIGFYGGGDADHFNLEAWGFDSTDILAMGGAGDDLLEAQNMVPAAVNDRVRFYGGSGDDILKGGFGDDVLVGGEGMDQIWGSLGKDLLAGNGGDDILDGGAHDDRIIGGEGDDMIIGGDGNDTIIGWRGSNTLKGGNGDDTIFGGESDDTMFGGAGNDKMYGGSGNDVMHGSSGDDIVNGNSGNDFVYGSEGNDMLVGGDGDDALFGFLGNDNLRGQGGNDRLFGQTGQNFLAGGEGDDVLSGGKHFDNLLGGNGRDTFLDSLEDRQDYDANEDVLDPARSLESFLGLTEAESESHANTLNRPSRVSWRDGESRASGADWVPRRLNFSILNGIVIQVRTDTGMLATSNPV